MSGVEIQIQSEITPEAARQNNDPVDTPDSPVPMSGSENKLRMYRTWSLSGANCPVLHKLIVFRTGHYRKITVVRC